MLKLSKIRHNPFYLLLGFIILAITSIGVTTALILIKTDEKINTFTPGNIACEVQENYSIKNTGNTNAYIRAEIITNWVDENGEIYAVSPDMEITTGDNWSKNQTDGYYYYANEVEANQTTTTLLANTKNNSKVPDGYTLSVTILAEALQASDGDKALQNAWTASE